MSTSRGTRTDPPITATFLSDQLKEQFAKQNDALKSHVQTELAAAELRITNSIKAEIKAQVTTEVSTQLSSALGNALNPVKDQVAHASRLLARLRQDQDAMARRMAYTRDRRLRFTITVEKAGATKEAAKAYVNGQITALGLKPLMNVGVFNFEGKPNQQAATVPCWAIVGELESTEAARQVLSKETRDLFKSEAKGFMTLGYENTKQEKEEEAILKASPAFTTAARAHEARTGQRPFFKYGKAYVGRDVWSVARLIELGEDVAGLDA
jgi:acetylornithine deacetylase/succinyl-diaminopimelate desuccinylase-like protein